MKPVIVIVSQSGVPLDFMVRHSNSWDASWVNLRAEEQDLITIKRYLPDLVIVDSESISNRRILTLIKRIKGRMPSLPLLFIARNSSEKLAIGALKAGANDYLKFPVGMDELITSIKHHLAECQKKSPSSLIASRIAAKMFGGSKIMTELKNQLTRISMVESTVLITGETGTGKELAAGLIHENSDRSGQSIVRVNCAALPDTLVESELFGHQRGAFTGAVATTCGRFQQAQGGTIFLDEIGDMTPFSQAKILRVIEDKQISPLGKEDPIPLDFRLITATNRNPEELIEEGGFRNDLFYRLNVARIHMPPLRNHPEDIPELIELGIKKLNLKFKCNIKGIENDVVNMMLHYEWPGNVRELMNVLEGAFINLPNRKINYSDLPVYFKKKFIGSRSLPSNERRRIISALTETNWNKSIAARKLNWSRMTLYRKLEKYHIIEKDLPFKSPVDDMKLFVSNQSMKTNLQKVKKSGPIKHNV